jgi:hypothetical protein
MNLAAMGTVNGPAAAAVLQEAGTQSAASGPIGTINAAGQRFTVATLTFVVDTNTLYDGVRDSPRSRPAPTSRSRACRSPTFARCSPPASRGSPRRGRPVSLAGRIEASPAGSHRRRPHRARESRRGAGIGTRARVSGSLDAQANTLTSAQAVALTDYSPAATARVELEGIALDAAAAGGAFRLRTPARDYEVAAGMTTVPISAGSRVRVIGTAASGTSLAPESVALVSPGQTYRVTGIVSELASLATLRVRGEPVDLTTAVIRGGARVRHRERTAPRDRGHCRRRRAARLGGDDPALKAP